MVKSTRTLLLLALLSGLSRHIVLADDDEPQATIHSENNDSVIILDAKAQVIAGLQSTVLEAGSLNAEFSVTGIALPLQALLTLRHRYLELLAENQQAVAKLKQAEQNTQRQQELYQHGVSAKRNLQEQQLQWHTEKSAVAANLLQQKALKEEAQLAWGNTLAAQALSTDASKLAGFLSGQDVLLHITLPVEKSLVSGNTAIYVDAAGHRNSASKARFISEAPLANTVFSGHSYFFKGQGRAIKPGMRVIAWIAEQKQAVSGVFIPKSAVIWLLDQVFVYVKTDKDKFSRRLLSDYTATSEAYFVPTGFAAGDEIVTTGAQMLLSEEQRRQIPDEDD